MTTAAEPWGKLDRNAPDVATAPRLSLVAHCIDVAAVMEALLALPTIAARLGCTAGRPLPPLDRIRLVALTFLHDIGKAGSGFQSRGMAAALRSAWLAHTSAGVDQSGHVGVVAPLFVAEGFEPWREALGVDEILDWGGRTPSGANRLCDLWLAAISHHGQPVTLSMLNGQGAHRWPTWKQPIGEYDPLHGLEGLGHAARALFPQAFAADVMDAFAPSLVHAYAGLVSLADWVASNTDEGFFPYSFAPQTLQRWPASRVRAAEVLRRMHLDVEPARADLQRRTPSFTQVFDAAPRPTQEAAARWQGDAEGRVVVLEAETGSGKTEAALWRFKTLFEAGEVDALCFLLPTRVAATGIYARIDRFVRSLFPDPALRPPTVLAVPGYLRANGDDGQRALAGFEVLWPDADSGERRPLYWAAENSKRYFAGCGVAATIDQFLLSALQVKHAHLRGALVMRALVVVDEVHASDAYMTALLRAALERHVRAGGHALLMSATLTGETRERLLAAGGMAPFVERGGGWLGDPTAPYPAVSTRVGLRGCPASGRDKQVQVELRPWMRDATAVAGLAATMANEGARVLVLRNTVRQAVETQQALEAVLGCDHPALFDVDGVRALHHGRYAFEDRRRLDARVEALFGKNAANSGEPRVLTGTQTLEISVDCDSDVMVTDIAPIDVLLQRLGRLHRHRERDDVRPSGFRQPRLIVLTPPDRDLAPLLAGTAARGLGIGPPRSAYQNLLAIEATWRLLEAAGEEGWEIPRDNRCLVEAGASTEAWRQLAEEFGGAWLDHEMAVCGKRSAQASQALPVLLRWHRPWAEAGWSDLGDEVRTRLGLDSLAIDLPRPWRTPLGSTIARLSVPAWMLRGGGATPLVSSQIEEGGELRLSFGKTALVYGRFGLRTA